jgi:uncharacterized protein involved in exopolysaccharide biosynthesis/Mrp family chromosome partitioning ATPase
MRDKPEDELSFRKPADPEKDAPKETPEQPPQSGGEKSFRVRDQFADLNTIHRTLDRKSSQPNKTPVPGGGLPESGGPAASIRRENDLQDFFRNLDIIKIMRGIYRRFWIALLCAFGMMLLLLPAARHLQGGISYTAEAAIIYSNSTQKQTDVPGSAFMLRSLSRNTLTDMLLSPGNIKALEESTGLEPLDEHLSFDSQSKSDIVSLQIQGMPDEKTAVQTVNRLAEIIIDNNAHYYREQAAAAHEQYQAQREKIEKELNDASQAVENFQRKNRLLELNTQYDNYFSSRNAAAERLSIAKVAREGLIVRIRNYEKMIAGLPDEVLDEAQEDNPLKRRISNAEAALLQARIQYAADNPKVKRQEREIEELRKMLQSGSFDETRERTYIPNPLKGQLQSELMKLRSEEEVAAQQLESLRKDLDEINARFEELPRLEKEYAELLEKRSALDASYKALKAGEKSTRLTMTSDLSDFRLLIPATQAVPGGSSLIGKIIPAAGFLFGFFGGLALILIIELLDAKLRTLHQIEAAYDAPCLASVVEIPGLENQNIYESLLPSVREISDRLNALLRGQKAKTFGFLSSLDGEGKSILSFSLARYYSSLNINVLFVSFDTKPNPFLPDQQNTAWPQAGIEEYLRGETELQDMLLSVDGVDVIRVHQMNAALLDLAKGSTMVRLWDLLRSNYDLIITDIPSVLDHPLAGSVSAFQDELIYVIASPVSDRKLVDAGLEFLEDRGAAPCALIFNRADPYYLEDIRRQRNIRNTPNQRNPVSELFDRFQKKKEETPGFIETPSLPPEDDQKPSSAGTETATENPDVPPEAKPSAGPADQAGNNGVIEEMTEEEELSFIEWMKRSKDHLPEDEEESGDDQK